MAIPFIQSCIRGVKVVQTDNPLFAQIELTSDCTYACGFCYNVWKDSLPMKKEFLSRSQAFRAAEILVRAHIFSGIISGGEPTMMKYLPDLVAYFYSNGIPMSVITNGSLLSEELLVKLISANVEFIQISMHNYKPSEMDMITNRIDSFERTLSGLKNVLKLCDPNRFGVNMVVTKSTVGDVYGMGEFLASLGVKNFSSGLVSYSGAAKMNDTSCNGQDFLRVFDQLERLSDKINVGIVGGYPSCILPANAMESKVHSYNSCDAGMSQIVIGPNGDMRPCVEMSDVVGNIFNDDLSEVWKHSKALQCIRKFENVPDGCLECAEVTDCHGGCRASALKHSGNLKGLDPLMEVCHES